MPLVRSFHGTPRSTLMKTQTASIPAVGLFLAAALLAGSARAAVLTVAYYRLGENDPGAADGVTANETAVDSGGSANLTRVGTAPLYSADTGVTGSTLSLEVNGGGYTRATPILTLTDNWGVEAWVQSDTTDAARCIVYNGNSGNSGMGIYQLNENFIGLIGGVAFVGSEPIVPGTWTHLAMVVMNGSTTFYVNGVANASGGAPRAPAGTFNVGIRPDLAEAFLGRLDEVRVFTFEPDQFVVEDLLLTQVPPNAQPPAIVSGPTATPGDQVMEGDALTLSVVAGGTAPLSYQWRKGGAALTGATGTTLTFDKVTLGDAGKYSVVVSSPHGSATSSELTVTVLPAGSPGVVTAAYYRLGETDPGATAGQPAGETTRDAEGNWHLTMVGNPPTYASETGVAGSTLSLAVDNGGYHLPTPILTATDNWGIEAWVQTDVTEENRCIVYNGNSSNSGMGIYQLGGRFAGLAGGVAVVGGANIAPGTWTHLAIVVTGGTMTFYVNGAATGTAGRPNAATTPDSAFHLGMKADGAEPFIGRIDEARVFTVVPGHFTAGDLLLSRVPPGALPPFVVSGPTASPGTTILTGGSFTLSLVAGGTAPLGYQWRRDGANLPGATSATLAFSDATSTEGGVYDVVVSNTYGSVTSPSIAIAIVPPGTPTVATAAYYRLGEADAGAADGQPASDTALDSAGLQNLSLVGIAPTYSAETGVNGSTLCLAVNGGGYRFEGPIIQDANNWGVEVWALGDTVEANRCLVYNGNSSNAGMGIYQIGDHYAGLVGGIAFVGSAPIVPGQWVHLALVVETGRTTFYVNGTENGTYGGAPNPPTPEGSTFSIGLKDDGVETFSGRLDEVRVFRVSLPGQFSTQDLLLTRVPPSGPPPSLTLQRSGSDVVVSWTAGNLERANAVSGPWDPVANATSPLTVPASGTQAYFRAVVR